jgi:hypothetical protein
VWGLTCGTPMTRETPSDRPGSTRQSSCQRPPYPRVRVAHRVGAAWGGTSAVRCVSAAWGGASAVRRVSATFFSKHHAAKFELGEGLFRGHTGQV